MKKLYFILFGTVITLALFVIPNPLVADDLMIGAVIHRFTGAPECIVLDPKASKDDEPATERKGRPGDAYTIQQFITNTCDRNIQVSVSLDLPERHYITGDSDDLGEFVLSPDETITAHATVTFGNDTPAEFSAKDVRFKVSRPE